MWKLWREYSKESRIFWLFSGGIFLFFISFFIYKLGIQKLSIEGIPQIILIVLFFFLASHLVWECYRQAKSWRKSKYRLLPIGEGTFYISNLSFSWLTTSIILFVYYGCFVALVFLLDQQADMTIFKEYWKHVLLASYFLFSAMIYLQFVYLLSCLLSIKVPQKLQKIAKYLFLFCFLAMEILISDELLNGYRRIGIVTSHQFTIAVGYIRLYPVDLFFDLILLFISSIGSVFILKKYIETQRERG